MATNCNLCPDSGLDEHMKKFVRQHWCTTTVIELAAKICYYQGAGN